MHSFCHYLNYLRGVQDYLHMLVTLFGMNKYTIAFGIENSSLFGNPNSATFGEMHLKFCRHLAMAMGSVPCYIVQLHISETEA